MKTLEREIKEIQIKESRPAISKSEQDFLRWEKWMKELKTGKSVDSRELSKT